MSWSKTLGRGGEGGDLRLLRLKLRAERRAAENAERARGEHGERCRGRGENGERERGGESERERKKRPPGPRGPRPLPSSSRALLALRGRQAKGKALARAAESTTHETLVTRPTHSSQHMKYYFMHMKCYTYMKYCTHMKCYTYMKYCTHMKCYTYMKYCTHMKYYAYRRVATRDATGRRHAWKRRKRRQGNGRPRAAHASPARRGTRLRSPPGGKYLRGPNCAQRGKSQRVRGGGTRRDGGSRAIRGSGARGE